MSCKESNSKSQITNLKQIPITKFEIPNMDIILIQKFNIDDIQIVEPLMFLSLIISNLEFICNLVIVICDLVKKIDVFPMAMIEIQ